VSEPAIVAGLAVATLGQRTRTDWLRLVEDYDRIRDLIARVIPGCENLNKKVRHKGGFYLPNGARHNDYKTATGKANFTECNVLVPITSVALGSNTPVSKAVVVTFAPSRVRNDAEANREHELAISG
jgi:hypothetical protein